MAMSSNTHGKPCQLTLNDMDCHVYYHIRFGVNFGTQFSVPIIIFLKSCEL